MTKTIDIADREIGLSDLVSMTAAGTQVVLTDPGTPVARVVPIDGAASQHERVPGLHSGIITTADDFDAPFPDSFWLGES